MELITIQNSGSEILHTDYWASEYAIRGAAYLSTNAGTFRLLVPDAMVPQIVEWKSAREVIVSRGPWPEKGKVEAIEILFDHGTDAPFVIHLETEQVDRLPMPADQDRRGQPPRWTFAVWTSGGKLLELPGRFRVVRRIPCLKEF